jgi:hypothetical protein
MLTPGQANGTWQICLFDTIANGISGSVGGTRVIFVTNPAATAAAVTVSGRVLTAEGRGVTNAAVRLTGPSGDSRTFVTRRGGAFTFNDVESGRTYTISVTPSGRFNFEPQTISVNDDLTNIEFRSRPAGF